MALLAVNIGNTTVHGALFRGGRIAARFRIAHLNTPRGLRSALAASLAGRTIEQVVLCSVVPPLYPTVAGALGKLTGRTPGVLTADAPHGLRIGYKDPSRLGTDRLAAALGARTLRPGENLVVIDCGTASTITALGADGTLFGGAILPGLGLWAEALSRRTAQLPAIRPARPSRPTGRSPEQAIASGLYHGHLGALERLVREISADCFGLDEATILTTGGNCGVFRREKLFTHIEPDLIVHGLAAFAANLRQDA